MVKCHTELIFEYWFCGWYLGLPWDEISMRILVNLVLHLVHHLVPQGLYGVPSLSCWLALSPLDIQGWCIVETLRYTSRELIGHFQG